MIRAKGFIVGIILLATAYTKGTDIHGPVKLDFVENVRAQSEARGYPSRVVSGWDANPGQHPHQVALRHVSAVGGVSACGGVLVHAYWVLTAAHCTARHVTVVVRAGLVSLTHPEYISETMIYYNHPAFDSSQPLVVQPNDIALVALLVPVQYTELTRPIRIQSRAEAFRDYRGEVAYASGFGRTWTGGSNPDVLQWVYLSMASNAECAMVFGTYITASSVCAGPYNVTTQSICQGDSGGPLIHINENGVPTLVGLSWFVAGGDFGCHSGQPGVFTRPGPYHDWIEQITGLDFENLDEVKETTTEEPNTATETPTTIEIPTTTEISTTTLEPESEEFSEESSEEDSSDEDSSEEDPDLKELLKRLEVQVKVKVKMNKYKKKHKSHVKHDLKKKKHEH